MLDRTIYHLIPQSEVGRVASHSEVQPISLAHEGFVHCATREQLIPVADDYFAQCKEPLLALEIEPSRLGSQVRFEAAAPIPGGGTSHLETDSPFPHIYGPIQAEAIAGVAMLPRSTRGFAWPRTFVSWPAAFAHAVGGAQVPAPRYPFELRTERVRLRSWRPADRAPFADMNADPEVMEFFQAPLTRAQSDALIDRWQSELGTRGWSNWALEQIASDVFMGFVGLSVPRWSLPFSPCVEVGWRLARRFWGNGYASEAARACLELGFDWLGLPEIVSFTALENQRSRRVMERIGMSNLDQDFEHPALPAGHALRRHCLCGIRNPRARSTGVRQ